MRILSGAAVGALVLFAGGATPALAAGGGGIDQITITNTQVSDGYASSLVVTLDKPVSTSTASQIKATLGNAMQASSPQAGPTGGEFLVCNKVHSFSDSDGTYTIQHACRGTTGPWGYRISTGVCAFTVSDVHEHGMAWTRNGRRQGTQAQHTEYCRYQFHGNYNPEHDFDTISYSDDLTFTIEVGGQRGSADLNIHGSFYSAICTNPSICP